MRIYFDENFSQHLAAGLRQVQDGRPGENVSVIWGPDEFGRGAADEEWIPKVAAKHGIIFTQDANIYRLQAQWEICQENKVGMFFLKLPQGGWGYWQIVEEVVRRWREVKELSQVKRPFGFIINPHVKKPKKL